MTDSGPVVWKHIGLHGHSIGSFTMESSGIRWQSAVMGGHDPGDVLTLRVIPASSISGVKWTVFGRRGYIRIRASGKNLPHELRFDGFRVDDFENLRRLFQQFYEVNMQKYQMSPCGSSFGNTKINDGNLFFRQCILEEANEEGEEFEPRDGEELLSLDMAEVSQCVLPGNNRNEIELQFHENDAAEAGTDQLVAVRFYIPPDPDSDPADRDMPTAAEAFQAKIMKNANIKNTTGSVIVEFDESMGTFLTPRGRYSIELYDTFLRMRGNKYDYKIKYDDISRLFLLPKPDEVHMAFVISLDKPIRQGQQRYQHLVMQSTKEPAEVTVNLDAETLQKEYNGDLQPVMNGALSNLVAKTFKVIAKKKVFIPGKFANASQHSCVKCALRANEGHLYPLEKQFVFIHKPPVLIRFEEVDSVEFQRYAGGQGSTRNFDLCVSLKRAAEDGPQNREYIFSGIDRSDYAGLYSFLSGKKIQIKNLENNILEERQPLQPMYNEDFGDGDDDESDDESYGKGGNDEESESVDDEDEDEDLGSGDDSDLEEARRAAGKAKAAAQKSKEGNKEKSKEKDKQKTTDKSKEKAKEKVKEKTKEKTKEKIKSEQESSGNPKKRPAPDDDDAGDDDDNDVEDDEEEPKKKAKPKGPTKRKKQKKDPNAPKKALTAFMFFSNNMRPKLKEENPDASFGDLARLVGARFKELTPEDRVKWDKMASKDKERYKEAMAEYSAPEEEDDDDDDDEGEKTKKGKKKKDPNAPKRPTTAYMLFNSIKRAEIKKENPDASFGDLARLVSAAYKELSEDDKAIWLKKAAEDKTRYEEQMKLYVPPKSSATANAKKPKAKKDPNMPKKPTTAYMFFSNAIRSRVKEKYPDLSFVDLVSYLRNREIQLLTTRLNFVFSRRKRLVRNTANYRQRTRKSGRPKPKKIR